MKINQKLTLSFAAIITPITLFSVFTITSIRHELKEVGDFHSPNLYLMQKLTTQTAEATEESFAYLASGNKKEKEDFLAWAEESNALDEQLKNVDHATFETQREERENIKLIIQSRKKLIEKAKQIFNEFEFKKSINNQLFIEYEDLVDRLLKYYYQAIEIEEKEVKIKQKKQ